MLDFAQSLFFGKVMKQNFAPRWLVAGDLAAEVFEINANLVKHEAEHNNRKKNVLNEEFFDLLLEFVTDGVDEQLVLLQDCLSVASWVDGHLQQRLLLHRRPELTLFFLRFTHLD